jgi:hypothetical protein
MANVRPLAHREAFDRAIKRPAADVRIVGDVPGNHIAGLERAGFLRREDRNDKAAIWRALIASSRATVGA